MPGRSGDSVAFDCDTITFENIVKFHYRETLYSADGLFFFNEAEKDIKGAVKRGNSVHCSCHITSYITPVSNPSST